MLVINENGNIKVMNDIDNEYTYSAFFNSKMYKKNIRNKYDSVLSINKFISIFFNKVDLILDKAVISRMIIENELNDIYNGEEFNTVYNNNNTIIRHKNVLYLFTGNIIIKNSPNTRILTNNPIPGDTDRLGTEDIIYITPGFEDVAENCKLVNVDINTDNIVTYSYAYKDEVYKIIVRSYCRWLTLEYGNHERHSFFPIIDINIYECNKTDNTEFKRNLYKLTLDLFDIKPVIHNGLKITKTNFRKVHIYITEMLNFNKEAEELAFYDCLNKTQKEELKNKYGEYKDSIRIFNKQKELQDLNKEILKLRGVSYEQQQLF